MSDRITPLPWRAGTHGGCIVADDPMPEESPLGRADESAITYYGGVLVGESMRTADVDYAVRAANEHEALLGLAQYAKHLHGCARTKTNGGLNAPGKCDCGFDDWLARLDAVRSGT